MVTVIALNRMLQDNATHSIRIGGSEFKENKKR